MKKLISAILCLSIALTMSLSMVVTVSADYTSIETDNFDEGKGSVDLVFGYSAQYVSKGANTLFTNVVNSGNANHLSLQAGVGYNESSALYIHTDVAKIGDNWRSTALRTKGFVLGENEELLVRYKVKFASKGKTGYLPLGAIQGSANSPGSTHYQINANSGAIKLDTWYTVIAKISGTTATKATKYYVLDTDGGTVATSATGNITINVASGNTEATEPVHVWPISANPTGGEAADSVLAYIDDVSAGIVSTLSTANIAFDETGSNVKNTETDVNVGRTFIVSFDHDLATGAESQIKLYKKGDSENPVNCTATKLGIDTVKLDPAANLDNGTEYVIDYSAVTGAGGQTAGQNNTVTFTTIAKAATPLNFVSAAATNGGSFTDGNLANVALDDTFTLTFDRDVVASPAVTLYKTDDANKTPVDVSATVSADKKSVTVTPSALLALNTGYTIDYSAVEAEDGGKATGTVTFTTVARRDALLITEDFEGVTGAPSAYTTGDFLRNVHTWSGPSYSFTNNGYKNSTGLTFDNASNSNNPRHAISSKAYSLLEGETIVFEYKLNVKSFTDSDASGVFSLGFTVSDDGENDSGGNWTYAAFGLDNIDGNIVFSHPSKSDKYTVDTNEYYTIVHTATRSGHHAYIYNEAGELVYETTPSGKLGDSVRFFSGATQSANVVANMTLDDFKVYRVSNDALDIYADGSTIANGDTDVAVSGSMTLSFNQPLKTGDEAKIALYCGSDKIDATVTTDGRSAVIITPSVTLNPGRTYTIKVDAPVSILGNEYAGLSEISFTTKTIYNVNAISSTLAVSSGAVSAGEKTVTLDNLKEAVNNAVLVVAIYSDSRPARLIGWEMFDIATIANGESTVTIELANSYQGAGSAEILLYNSMASLKPLMKSYKISK